MAEPVEPHVQISRDVEAAQQIRIVITVNRVCLAVDAEHCKFSIQSH